jgi:hypothetical protein
VVPFQVARRTVYSPRTTNLYKIPTWLQEQETAENTGTSILLFPTRPSGLDQRLFTARTQRASANKRTSRAGATACDFGRFGALPAGTSYRSAGLTCPGQAPFFISSPCRRGSSIAGVKIITGRDMVASTVRRRTLQ